ncbi:MAG: hypothetical protein K2X54_11450 [Methylobacterium organophilum]|nr:hypothetical protein [Methylobacterium organophilum]
MREGTVKKGYPKEVVIDELLGRACRELSSRTGERYCLALDTEAQRIQAVRLTVPDYRVTTCPLCETVIETSPRGLAATAPKMGFCLEIGFSAGGWGFRQDHAKFSAEVCRECHDEVMAALRPGLDLLAQRRDEVRAGSGRRRPGSRVAPQPPAPASPKRLSIWRA